MEVKVVGTELKLHSSSEDLESANLGRETEGNAGSKLRGDRKEGIIDFAILVCF